MAIPLQLRRGTTAQHTTFTGAVGEVTVDTDKDTLIVHDGTTAGGFQVAKTTKTSTNNAIARFDGITGAIKNSVVIIDDNGNETINGVAATHKSINDLNGNIGISGWALEYTQNVGNGYHSWSTSSNTTAGQAISYVERMRIDRNGNLGLGVTPSAWQTGWKALEIGNISSVFDTGSSTWFGSNVYRNTSGIFTYKSSWYASAIQNINGQHVFFTAPSGTAGNPITWTNAMTLDANSKLAVTGGVSVGNVANAGATVLDWYEEATATLTATGMTTAPTVSCKFTRIGNVVTTVMGYLNGTSNATSFTFTGVPTSFRPSTSAYTSPIAVKDNGIYSLGLGTLDASGNITLNNDFGGTLFTATGAKGTNTCTFTYTL